MTTQPTQPEAAQSPLADRVSRLEGIAEQVNERLGENTLALNTMRAENHAEHESLRAEHQALRAEVRTEVQSLREENQALRMEHQAMRAEHRAEIQSLRAENQAEHQSTRAEVQRVREENVRLRADMNRQTVVVVGVLGGLMALFQFMG